MTAWSIEGKTCVVSGANSGIGKETALSLARSGATVVMLCRDRDRGEAARAEIASAATTGRVELVVCDMASFASIRQAASQLLASHDQLHVLVNNAGTMFASRTLTEDGIEANFAVNHLGYFLVTNLLLARLRASAPARIISVASAAHRMSALDWGNLQGEKRYGELSAYGLSKLCNIMFTYALARRLAHDGVTANCLHPGMVASNFGKSAGLAFRTLVRLGRGLILTPEQGARTSVYLATSPQVDGVTGTYFARCKPARSSHRSHDREAQERLWDLSQQLTGPASP